MDEVYKNSAVTRGAASSKAVNEGFLQTEAATTWKIPFQCANSNMGMLNVQHTIEYNPAWEPLSRRAWSLQEDILSPRMLTYESWDVTWRCDSAILPEEYNVIQRLHKKSKRMYIPKATQSAEMQALAAYWSEIVRDYSGRDLSFHEDKLPAIAGVAREAQRRWGLTYAAGMWRECLLNQLGWHALQTHQQVRRYRPTRYAAPSWSWASCNYVVSLPFNEDLQC
jgi:hypothetical protein